MTDTALTSDTSARLASSAAEALAAALPVSTPVAPHQRSTNRDVAALTGGGNLVVASFVGQAVADLAVHLDPGVLGDSAALDPTVVALDDVLRPALEAAVSVLGTGVLSSAPAETAAALLEDARSELFVLQLASGAAGAGRAVGWFAIRLRESGSAAVPASRASGYTSLSAASVDPHDEVSARLSRLNNVQMGLTVEIGRTRVSVRDVLALEPGAVIELDRNAGAPADVRLNGRLIAQGEVVVMDQDYGVRITKILDSAEGLS